MESIEIGREAKVYESLWSGETNQGQVTTYKIFTSQSIHKEQGEVRYSTHQNRLVSAINLCTEVKIDVFVYIESELSLSRSTSKVMWQSGEKFVSFLVFVCGNIYIVKESDLKFQCYHSDIKVCLLNYLDIFRNLGHYIWFKGVYAILADIYH